MACTRVAARATRALTIASPHRPVAGRCRGPAGRESAATARFRPPRPLSRRRPASPSRTASPAAHARPPGPARHAGRGGRAAGRAASCPVASGRVRPRLARRAARRAATAGCFPAVREGDLHPQPDAGQPAGGEPGVHSSASALAANTTGSAWPRAARTPRRRRGPGGGRGTERTGSRPRASRCASTPAAPNRLAASAAGSRAKSPSVRMPSRGAGHQVRSAVQHADRVRGQERPCPARATP